MKIKQLKKVLDKSQEVEISTMDYYSVKLYSGVAKNIPSSLDSKLVGVIGAMKNPSSIIGTNAIYICVEP